VGHSLGAAAALQTAAWLRAADSNSNDISDANTNSNTDIDVATDADIVPASARPQGRVFRLPEGGAVELVLDSVVAASPFTTLHAMAKQFVGNMPFLSLLLRHNFDNMHSLAVLKDTRRRFASGVHVSVLHGARDEIIPVAMGQAVATTAATAMPAEYIELPEYGHNDVFTGRSEKAIFEAMRRVVAPRGGESERQESKSPLL
jgi:pimeloyl-ACP methyl ester carboxylesterase